MSTFPETLQSSLLREQQGEVAIRNEKMLFLPLKPTQSLFSLQDVFLSPHFKDVFTRLPGC